MRTLAIFAALLLAQSLPQPLHAQASPQPPAAQTSPQPPQDKTYAQPFEREGSTKVMENNRVIVWDVSWLQRAYPTHRHMYDYTGVYYASGDRVIVNLDGSRRPTHTNAWDTFFLRKGITHSEEGASAEPLRAIMLELKEPAAEGAPATASTGLGKNVRESDRIIIWQDFPPQDPQPLAHHHEMDCVAVAFIGGKPKVTWVPKGTVDHGEETAGADRAYFFELK
ncbi:MAG TPA: hypothetical protein VN678_12920 [Acidobacteriaceae bacterium]|nr:hypothetical protein [Acidobacteriaceae bacterium]